MHDGRAQIEPMTIAGRKIEVMRIAPIQPALPTLVFLHEGLGSIDLWRDFPANVAARTGCGAVVYSRYGNGFSEPLAAPRDPRYMHAEALDALPELLGRLGIESPVLIGHSDGASIALIFAGAFPDRVRALVLEAPHVFVEDLSVASIAAIGADFRKGDLRERMLRHHKDADRTFCGWNEIWLDPSFRSWNIESSLATIDAPVLCIQGSEDRYGTLAQLDAVDAGTRGPVDRVVIAGCGHAPHRERASFVENVVVQWLETNARRRS